MKNLASFFFLNTILMFISIIDNTKSSSLDHPYIKTPLGGVHGRYRISSNGKKFAAFFDIPYALPPVGKLRFEPPQPIPVWSKDVEYSNLTKICLQDVPLIHLPIGEEDCLYLNVFAPVTSTNKSLPILFWIHGGGFLFGSKLFVLPENIMNKNVILVTVNYRLGSLGFLSTGDEVAPGNAGLKDQNLALRWVRNNIRYFGGDPTRITLAGESAGAASVHYHYLSPMSRGLFRGGMSFSGTVLAPWAHAMEPKNVTWLFAESAGCPIDNSVGMIKCLKGLSAERIIGAAKLIAKKFRFIHVLFTPVTENSTSDYFINRHPEDILREGPVYDVPWVATTVKDEGYIFTANFVSDKKYLTYLDENWNTLAPYQLHYNYNKPEQEYEKIAERIREHYFGGTRLSEDENAARNLTKLLGDGQFAVPLMRATQLQSKINKSPVWSYYYSYARESGLSGANKAGGSDVPHCADVFFPQWQNMVSPLTTPNDKAMVQKMLSFWYTFATWRKVKLGAEWAAVDPNADNFKYMHVAGPGHVAMEYDDNFGNIKFWTSIGL